MRGQVVEFDPGRRVVVQLATGEVRQIPWDEILRASWISVATASSSAPAVAVPANAGSSTALHTSVTVRIVSPNPKVLLEARDHSGGVGAWQNVCRATCGRSLEVEDREFRITGAGLRPSNPFHFVGDQDSAKLVVSPGKQSNYDWGRVAIIAGAATVIASGALAGWGKSEDRNALVAGGIVGLALGGVMLVVSIPLLTSGRTTVQTSGANSSSSAWSWTARNTQF